MNKVKWIFCFAKIVDEVNKGYFQRAFKITRTCGFIVIKLFFSTATAAMNSALGGQGLSFYLVTPSQ